MKNLGIYLVFNGECKAAFSFYEKVFSATATFTYFGDFPAEGSDAEVDKERVMNASLIINENTAIMGCDPPVRMGETKAGQNFNVMLNTSSREESDKLFAGLAEGGHISMPMSDQFWGAYFGMITDKFGIQWMISFTV